MVRGIEIAERIREVLERVYPNALTADQIFKEVGVADCGGRQWLRTLEADREIECAGRIGRKKAYRIYHK